MLAYKLACEKCNKKLPTESREAFFCSYECTFCETCAQSEFNFICPNCGGNIEKRPTRVIKKAN